MNNNIEFDNNFSFPSLETELPNNKVEVTPKTVIETQQILNLCQKQDKIINEQTKNLLLLIEIINKYQKERFNMSKDDGTQDCKKALYYKKMINVIVMIFILIMFIVMIYIHKHRILGTYK
jgi:hypothetical protein